MADIFPCSWCGGFLENPHAEEEKIVEFMKVEIAPVYRHPQKPNELICCVKCYYKIFHNVLGQPMYHGFEVKHLKDLIHRKGYKPQRPSAIEDDQS